MGFKEIYEEGLINSKKQIVETSNLSSKPILITGIISPESKICINPSNEVTFELDKKGMEKIIGMFQDRWNVLSDEERKNLMHVLREIFLLTQEYLGGIGNPAVRLHAYEHAKNLCLSLSEIEGKQIGLCAERAAIGHQLLSILEQTGILNFESYLTNSYITTKEMRPHAFIVLKHHKDESKQFIFDIENPIEYHLNGKTVQGIALYSMTKEEYKDFINGKNISPKNVLEQIGISALGEKRAYGNEYQKERTD